jgi:rfaE bifunctional protein nucleotidyltransferase chain/domain
MKTMPRITTADSLGEWRRAVAGAAPVAVLTGTFDFFHPGNLYALRQARRLAMPVVVLVDPGELAARRGRPGHPQNTAETRVEMVTHLRGVAAVASLAGKQLESALAGLAPYVWVTIAGRRRHEATDTVLAARASRIEAIKPLAGFFSGDVIRAMDAHRTPLALPPGWDAGIEDAAATAAAKTRVTVNGCFDILHVGHLRFLAEARMMGDSLTVLINNDVSVARYKGPTRPVFPEAFRAAALKALASVDDVLAFPGDNPLAELQQLRPAIHVKGGSFEPDRVRQERELVESWGGRLVCTPMVDGFSTTRFINKALERD